MVLCQKTFCWASWVSKSCFPPPWEVPQPTLRNLSLRVHGSQGPNNEFVLQFLKEKTVGRIAERLPLCHFCLWLTDSAWKQLVWVPPPNLSLLWLFYFYFWFLKLKKKSSICHLQEFALRVAEDGKKGLLRSYFFFCLKLGTVQLPSSCAGHVQLCCSGTTRAFSPLYEHSDIQSHLNLKMGSKYI